ncbi:hypothetical protein Shyhy02_81580 [Streptomyces hygroscopicus subsp. hygroscopicus]|nr:hypothetical protein Shyhy02_81580 [Streptomyces hygroscopicus subsp. hygroscopicus]
MALLHLPFDSAAGLDTETLCTEGQVAILPASHPLADRSQLWTADITTRPTLPMARWLAGPLPAAATQKDRAQKYGT